jgi:hypothetical protein
VKVQAVNGVPLRVANTSETHSALLTGLSLYGDPGRVRVLCSRAHGGVSRANDAWDWRCYVVVADVPDVQLSFTCATEIRFSVAVPLEPGQTTRFYIYSHAKDARNVRTVGIAYRRFPQTLCAQDETLECRMANGNFGGELI